MMPHTIEPNSAEVSSCWFVGNLLPVGSQQLPNAKKELARTVFMYHNGHAHPTLERLTTPWPHSRLRSLIVRLNRFHQARANRRSLEYMTKLINRRLGDIGPTEMRDLSAVPGLRGVDQIILLWPDGNGLGWSHIENRIFDEKNASTPIYVLNGRNRVFELQKSLWRGYRFRRFLEKSFLLEFGVLGLFLLTTPVLTFWDMVREAMQRDK